MKNIFRKTIFFFDKYHAKIDKTVNCLDFTNNEAWYNYRNNLLMADNINLDSKSISFQILIYLYYGCKQMNCLIGI